MEDAIYKIIRCKCISNAAAQIAAQEVTEFLNNPANCCKCTPDETTGSTTWTHCNICGLVVKE